MREIKFRAWHKEEKKMYENAQATYDWGNARFPGCPSAHFQEVIDDTDTYVLMQYTGLKDKNGKEIYEGDIVKHENFPLEVRYKAGQWIVTEGLMDWILKNIHDYSEVIGNIYENPELLK